jgi:putative acetyltransferase
MIREEWRGDEAEIHQLVEAAFRNAEHSSGTEARIVDALRSAGALTLSLVAVEGTRLAGHAAFSPVTIEGQDVGWLGLGPIAVLPDLQGQGVGAALIQSGVYELSAQGARGCVVLGDPGYYARFGFRREPHLRFPGPPPEYFQALRFAGEVPAGDVAYHSAFEVA